MNLLGFLFFFFSFASFAGDYEFDARKWKLNPVDSSKKVQPLTDLKVKPIIPHTIFDNKKISHKKPFYFDFKTLQKNLLVPNDDKAPGAGSSGGGSLSLALKQEQTTYTKPWHESFENEAINVSNLYPGWLGQTTRTIARGGSERYYWLSRNGARLINILFLGGYYDSKLPEGIDRGKVKEIFKDLVNHSSLREGFTWPGYTGHYQYENGKDLVVGEDKVLAINFPLENKLAFELSSLRTESDCHLFQEKLLVNDKETAEKMCHALMASMLGAHELLSLVGLEGNRDYSFSLAARSLLHKDDRLNPGFTQHLIKGIREFYGIDENFLFKNKKNYGNGTFAAPGVINDFIYNKKYPGRAYPRGSFFSKEYSVSVNKLFDAKKTIVFILSRNMNVEASIALKKLYRELTKYHAELNEHYKGSLSKVTLYEVENL